MGRSPDCIKDDCGLKKGPWTPEEDDKLIKYIQQHGHGSWRALPKLASLKRCGKSCRLRWRNYLRPDIKRGKFSEEEEKTILNLHAILGNKWSAIATHLPGRTDNEIKNFWNTHLKKKLIRSGFDPITHEPALPDIFSTVSSFIALANLKELIENPTWGELAKRLQAEAVQLDQLRQYFQHLLVQPPPPIPATFQNNDGVSPDLSALDFLNSLLILSSFETSQPPPFLGGVDGLHDSVPFSHLPDLRGEFSAQMKSGSDHFEAAILGQEENSVPLAPSWIPTNLSPPVIPEVNVAAGIDDFFTNTEEYERSSSSQGAAQTWSEFMMNDPLFRGIA